MNPYIKPPIFLPYILAHITGYVANNPPSAKYTTAINNKYPIPYLLYGKIAVVIKFNVHIIVKVNL